MEVTFEVLQEATESAGLKLLDHGCGHWQITGGHFVVNYYPDFRTQTLYVNGTSYRKHFPSIQEILLACFKAPDSGRKIAERKSTYKRIRKRLFNRDPHCHWCKMGLSQSAATIDHRIPLDCGGTNGYDNLVLSCEKCNKARANTMPEVDRFSVLRIHPDAWEYFNERAAIMEFDGNMPRNEAESMACGLAKERFNLSWLRV